MPRSRPWYKRHPGDFIVATMHMPPVERGTYSLIIDMLNDRGKPIPDDPKFICGFTGLTKQKWGRVRKYLINDRNEQGEPKIVITPDGYITNPRFEREQKARAALSDKRSEAGRAGGKKSGETRRAQSELEFDDGKPISQVSGDISEENVLGAKDLAEASASQSDTLPDLEKPEKPISQQSDDIENGKSQKSKGDDEPSASLLHEKENKPRKRKKLATFRQNRNDDRPENQSLSRSESPEARYTSVHTSNVESKGRDDERTDDDLFQMTIRATDAAQMSARIASRPSLLTASVDIVKRWIDAGIPIDLIVDTIEKQMRDATEPTTSLNRFGVAIDKAFAASRHTKAKTIDDVPKAAYTFADEDPRIADLRRKLESKIGEWKYRHLFSGWMRFRISEPYIDIVPVNDSRAATAKARNTIDRVRSDYGLRLAIEGIIAEPLGLRFRD